MTAKEICLLNLMRGIVAPHPIGEQGYVDPGHPASGIDGLPELILPDFDPEDGDVSVGRIRRRVAFRLRPEMVDELQGLTLFLSLGKRLASFTFARPRIFCVSRSQPMANPPWGGQPYLKMEV